MTILKQQMSKPEILTAIGQALLTVRAQKPLVYHLTNYVTVNDCANATLAIGGSPVMADACEEAADITSISQAVVINIGTLNPQLVEAMLLAGKKANELNIPVILDPVGAGASALRGRTVANLLKELKVSILRCNMSELRCVAGLQAATRGVDAAASDLAGGIGEGKLVANRVAKELNCVVAVTGAVDIIADGKRTLLLANGTPRLSGVTGTGCMCSSLCGAFAGAGVDAFIAAAGGVMAMGLAGEIAEEKAGPLGSGSFHMAVIDALSLLDDAVMAERGNTNE